MYPFVPGMRVIVSRTYPLHSSEKIIYDKLPKKETTGILETQATHPNNEGWVIRWDSNSRSSNRFDRILEWMISPFEQFTLTVGEEVVYSSGIYGDSLSNPLWNGEYGRIKGKIVKINLDTQIVKVDWKYFEIPHDTIRTKKVSNLYSIVDLFPASLLKQFIQKNIKQSIELMCKSLYEENNEDTLTGDRVREHLFELPRLTRREDGLYYTGSSSRSSSSSSHR